MRAALPGPQSAASRYAVAFSGGLDSTVLLAALSRIADRGAIRALHVDHHLHPDSSAWAAHCERVSARLGVPFVGLDVSVDRRGRIGIEAAARRARYAALAAALAPDEILLTAHHADDQLETLLLRLLRGAGIRGMRGILPVARLGGARVARPLLGFTRAELAAMAERWRLDWLEDPSNRSLDFDRNLVRSRLAPVIRERWGDSAALRAGRLAAAMRDAESILDDVARRDLAEAGAERGRVPLAPLRALGEARQRNALRQAIRDAGLPMPDARRLDVLRGAIGRGPDEAARRIEWRGAEARIHRDRLYLFARASAPDDRAAPDAARRREPPLSSDAARRPAASSGAAGTEPLVAARAAVAMRVSATEPWHGPEGRIVLEPAPPSASGLPESWAVEGLDVRFRRGGERFKPAGAAHHRRLKAWLREQGVVPWMRARIPLLYHGGRLVAVADLAIDDAACRARPDEPRWRVRWLDHPRID
ncbi:MAG TPA: tRNA lysidine(34) synthetase TilS [Gammaproteobacteria bacterium]